MDNLTKQAQKFYDQKDFKQAAELYTKALKSSDQNADVFEKRAMSFYHQNQLNDCLADLSKAQQLQPNNPYRYSSRAFVKNQMGDLDGAIEDYQKAVHLDPGDAIAYNNLGLVLEAKGYAEKARKSFSKADLLIKENPTPASIESSSEKSLFEEKKEDASPNSPVRFLINNIGEKGFLKEFIGYIKNGFQLEKKNR